ncbi:hypothetical protein DL95DRAFT_444240 [Leptodontidium sp. 2 PMI_412]|nr:hypothetical protein DL95DRAFT_444240 [Leptodontidium sp. 2 PMI_412]
MTERQTNQTEVPPPQDPDRKRVLNVLAQRRYRQRQRNRMQELERKTAELSGEGQRSLPRSDGSDSMSNEQLLQTQRQISPAFTGASAPRLIAPAIPNMHNIHDMDMQTNMMVSNPWTSAPPASMVPVSSSAQSDWMSGTQAVMNPYHGSPSPNSELQDLEISQFQFPDDALLNVFELKVMRASYDIAILLQCEETIWNLDFRRTFNETTSRSGEPLPPSFLPTEEQQLIPHHPILDILPWPAVRSKLIRVFNRAPEFRPPVCRDPYAIARLLQDMEDPAEGLRVNGPDGFDSDNWEVGQKFLLNWWWALECSVIEKSSASRVSRGAEHLTLP